jgi:2',3'-cyclic-nucleotide 2'-phosphodiesterase (5'-nucleotidase family)
VQLVGAGPAWAAGSTRKFDRRSKWRFLRVMLTVWFSFLPGRNRVLIGVMLGLVLPVVAVRGAGAKPEAIFVAIADEHSAYERTAQVVARVDRVKAENPGVPLAVLIDGDVFEAGNGVAARSRGVVDFAMLRALARRAPTVLNLGNHEAEFFDLAETVARARAAGVTVVGNITNRETGELFAPASAKLRLEAARSLGTRDEDSKARASAFAGTPADREARRYVEVVVAGEATDAAATYRAGVRPTLGLANPVDWGKRNLAGLLAGAPVKVVLSHAGLRSDRELLELVPDGTLFVGAHDHLRFVHRAGRTVYFHSGSWNGFLSIARLRRDAAGAPDWEIEQVRIKAGDPADPQLAKVIAETRARYLAPADLAPIGRLPQALDREAAARFVVRAVRRAAAVDAAFIGNTTFGGGLPAGEVSREALDGCVRFDGTICVAEVSGGRLREFLRGANQGADTTWEERRGEFLFADSLAASEIDPGKVYRIATNDWGMKNRGRYFGSEAIAFAERPELRLKAIAREALNHEPEQPRMDANER